MKITIKSLKKIIREAASQQKIMFFDVDDNWVDLQLSNPTVEDVKAALGVSVIDNRPESDRGLDPSIRRGTPEYDDPEAIVAATLASNRSIYFYAAMLADVYDDSQEPQKFKTIGFEFSRSAAEHTKYWLEFEPDVFEID